MKFAIIFFAIFFCNHTFASGSNWHFILEGGALFQSKSDVKIPPDTGTLFSLVDAVGYGPLVYGRVETKYTLSPKHRLRLLLAPLAIEEQGQLDQIVTYNGNTFAADTDTTYRYQFNSYRLSYAYRFFENSSWSGDIGLTGKIRHAEIALTQGAIESRYPNIGFVPLIHFAVEKRFTPQWELLMDLDAAWSPYGRAFDLGLFTHYHFNKTWSIGAGYRTVEGGADVDVVYNFAWIHYAGLRLAARF